MAIGRLLEDVHQYCSQVVVVVDASQFVLCIVQLVDELQPNLVHIVYAAVVAGSRVLCDEACCQWICTVAASMCNEKLVYDLQR